LHFAHKQIKLAESSLNNSDDGDTTTKQTCNNTQKMAKKRKIRARAPGMTQISISLPEGLVGMIDEMADAENRNRSNFIATVLENLSSERGVKAAEGSKKFG